MFDRRAKPCVITDGYSKETESFSKFTINSNRNTVISQPVTSILGDKAGNIWISVDSQGLFSFNKKTRKLQNYQFNGPGQMVTGNVTHFLFDSKGRCWISFYSDNLYYSDDSLNLFIHFRRIRERSLSATILSINWWRARIIRCSWGHPKGD